MMLFDVLENWLCERWLLVMCRPLYLFWVRSSIDHRPLKEPHILMMVNGSSDQTKYCRFYIILFISDSHSPLSLSLTEFEWLLVLFILCIVVFVFAKYLPIHQCFMGFDWRKPFSFLSHHFRSNVNRAAILFCGIERMQIV